MVRFCHVSLTVQNESFVVVVNDTFPSVLQMPICRLTCFSREQCYVNVNILQDTITIDMVVMFTCYCHLHLRVATSCLETPYGWFYVTAYTSVAGSYVMHKTSLVNVTGEKQGCNYSPLRTYDFSFSFKGTTQPLVIQLSFDKINLEIVWMKSGYLLIFFSAKQEYIKAFSI